MRESQTHKTLAGAEANGLSSQQIGTHPWMNLSDKLKIMPYYNRSLVAQPSAAMSLKLSYSKDEVGACIASVPQKHKCLVGNALIKLLPAHGGAICASFATAVCTTCYS